MNTDQMTEYCSRKSNESLAFIIQDCREAVRAMPMNPKAIEYLQLASEAERQLNRRERLAMWRKTLRDHGFDYLTVNETCGNDVHTHIRRRNVRDHNRTGYVVDRIRSATWMLGGYRRFGLI